MNKVKKRKIKIKIAQDKDSEEITSLYRKLYEGEETQKFFSSNAIPSYLKAGSRVFIARENNKIIGFIWAIFYEHIKNKGVGIIEELYIDDGYRREGIGKSLVGKAVAYLAKHSIVVLVTTEAEMKDAQMFYEALGFKKSREWYYYDISQFKDESKNKFHNHKNGGV